MAQFNVDGRGRSLASPQFPGDDGAADEAVRGALAEVDDDIALARSLRGARLLSSVVAVLDAVGEDGSDKDSHMAVVSMVNERGERGLLAFTGIDSLAAWNPDARPVPAYGRDVARAAVTDGCEAVVIDVAGPRARVLAGAALQVLVDELDIAALSAAISVAMAALTSDGWVDIDVVDARDGDQADLLVVVTAQGGAHPDGRSMDLLVRQAAQVLSARPDLLAQVPGGIGIVASRE